MPVPATIPLLVSASTRHERIMGSIASVTGRWSVAPSSMVLDKAHLDLTSIIRNWLLAFWSAIAQDLAPVTLD